MDIVTSKQFLSSRYPLQLVPTMMNNKDFSIGRTDVKFTIHLGTGYNGSRRVLQSTLRNVLEGIQKGMRPLVLAALTVCFLFFFFFSSPDFSQPYRKSELQRVRRYVRSRPLCRAGRVLDDAEALAGRSLPHQPDHGRSPEGPRSIYLRSARRRESSGIV